MTRVCGTPSSYVGGCHCDARRAAASWMRAVHRARKAGKPEPPKPAPPEYDDWVVAYRLGLIP